jgi:hypothetical protein
MIKITHLLNEDGKRSHFKNDKRSHFKNDKRSHFKNDKIKE